MKTVILAGGLGSRLQEETTTRPKPMVEIGGRPILWHIMNHYAAHGCREFVIALGYKGEVIKDYFLRYRERSSNLSINLATGDTTLAATHAEDWLIHLIDTGERTQTAGRLHRLAPLLSGQPFLLTYGDGVSDVDISQTIAFHRNHGRLATVTAVRPPARFGALAFDGDRVDQFLEKQLPRSSASKSSDDGFINGGFFVCEPTILDYLGPNPDATPFETTPLERIARDKQLMAYKHTGFWQCMDTVRDRQHLEELWSRGNAPWALPPPSNPECKPGVSSNPRCEPRDSRPLYLKFAPCPIANGEPTC